MLYDTQSQTRSVYIHWPFCPYKCHFCPFVAFSGQDQLMASYHDALVQEIRNFAERAGRQFTLDTIYFGGGTPSTYPNELLLDMLAILRRTFAICQDTEITLEVNPGTVDTQKLDVWKRAGINRLSVGVQSLKDRVLEGLNRHQKFDDVVRLMDEVGAFCTNVSVDCILGLPGVPDHDWQELLAKVVTWPVKHVSLYLLEVHEGTALHMRIKKKDLTLPDEDRLADLYAWSVDFLLSHGFQQYEVSSFALPGYRSRHNTTYWNHKPYKGFGIGACSFDGTTRFQNETNVHAYLKNMQQGNDVTCSAELLTRQQVINEKIMLGVRRAEGIALTEVQHAMSLSECATMNATIALLKKGELVIERNGRLMLTPRGLLVENSIATQLSL